MYVQEINGIKYALKNGAFNAACIIAVSTPVTSIAGPA